MEFRFDKPVKLRTNETVYFAARDREQCFGFSAGLQENTTFENEYFVLKAGKECDRSGSDEEFLNGRVYSIWKLPVGQMTIASDGPGNYNF